MKKRTRAEDYVYILIGAALAFLAVGTALFMTYGVDAIRFSILWVFMIAFPAVFFYSFLIAPDYMRCFTAVLKGAGICMLALFAAFGLVSFAKDLNFSMLLIGMLGLSFFSIPSLLAYSAVAAFVPLWCHDRPWYTRYHALNLARFFYVPFLAAIVLLDPNATAKNVAEGYSSFYGVSLIQYWLE